MRGTTQSPTALLLVSTASTFCGTTFSNTAPVVETASCEPHVSQAMSDARSQHGDQACLGPSRQDSVLSPVIESHEAVGAGLMQECGRISHEQV